MEDVNYQRSKSRWSHIVISIIYITCSTYCHAANQGVLGTSSTGSVSITVTIPETVRLFANHFESESANNESFVCIQITDRGVADNSSHYYRIKQAGMTDTESLHKLKNRSISKIKHDANTKCDLSDSLIKLESPDSYSTKASVLMLVPE